MNNKKNKNKVKTELRQKKRELDYKKKINKTIYVKEWVKISGKGNKKKQERIFWEGDPTRDVFTQLFM
tara:strand:- start:410 stop:613 length:204 start_codon:yes stop_codon:yes gene_type:complete